MQDVIRALQKPGEWKVSLVFSINLFTLAFEYISVLFVYEANKPRLCDDSSGSCGGSVKFEDHIIMLQDARHRGRRNYK